MIARQRRRPPRGDLQRVEAAPGDAHHPDLAACTTAAPRSRRCTSSASSLLLLRSTRRSARRRSRRCRGCPPARPRSRSRRSTRGASRRRPPSRRPCGRAGTRGPRGPGARRRPAARSARRGASRPTSGIHAGSMTRTPSVRSGARPAPRHRPPAAVVHDGPGAGGHRPVGRDRHGAHAAERQLAGRDVLHDERVAHRLELARGSPPGTRRVDVRLVALRVHARRVDRRPGRPCRGRRG